MFSMFTHSFMVYALILGIGLAISAACLSPFLVFSNQAMIADGMSHIAFTGVILGFLFSEQPLYFALPFVVLASFAITYMSGKEGINNDAAIGVVSAVSLAIGLIIATVGSGFNRSIESLLVGSILTVTKTEMITTLLLAMVVIVFVVVNYRSLLSMTFDENYARFRKVKVHFLRYALTACTAMFVVLGVRSAGTLLISAFVIFPSLSAVQLARSFKQTLILGVCLAIVGMFMGIVASYHLNFPTGSTIVLAYTLILLCCYGLKKVRGN
ncbi:hypothetical protein A4S06_09245 [Erysipelotrichaceae bacterium MTC7]|nr:hypothetical protein A4S06_09245 [Erysipelotrichaceae bacterium MTC7]